MKKFLIILAIFTFVPFAHSAAVDEGAELAAIINAQVDAKDKVLVGLGYLSERSANATTLAQNSYSFLHALKEALQSGVITKEDVQAYKDLFNPVTAPLASVMQSGAWNPRVERLYADLEVKYEAVQKTVQKQMPQEMQKEYEEQDEQVRAPDQPYRQVLLAPEGEQAVVPLDDDEALQEAIERSLQEEKNEDDIALQAAIAESMQMQEEAKPEVVEAASSQTPAERAREMQEVVQERMSQKEIEQAVEQIKTLDDAAIARIQQASGTIKDVTIDMAVEDKEELKNAVQTMLQKTIESITLNDTQTKALFGALVIDDKDAMHTYLAGLDKDTKIALLEAANYLNAPLLQMMSQQSLEDVATEQDIESLPPELAEPLMRDAVHKALVAYDVPWSYEPRMLKGHHGTVASVAFSPDGSKIASGAGDGTVRIWNAQSGEQEKELTQGGWVRSVAFSPDGSKIASSGALSEMRDIAPDYSIRIWDVQTGEQERVLRGRRGLIYQANNGFYSVAWSPDGKKIAFSNNKSVYVFDRETGDTRRILTELNEIMIFAIAWSPDSTKIAYSTSALSNKGVRIWDMQTEQIRDLSMDDMLSAYSVAWSPDGTKIAADLSNNRLKVKNITIWNAQTGEQERVLENAPEIMSVAFSPDSKKLASAGKGNVVHIWDVHTGKKEVELTGPKGSIWSVAWAPDGVQIAAGSKDSSIYIWQKYQTLDQCTLDELFTLYQAVPSWRARLPYVMGPGQLAHLKEQYKDSGIAPLLNDKRLFTSFASAVLNPASAAPLLLKQRWQKK